MAGADRKETSNRYATASDFEQVFTEHMSSLYLLSLLLTANRAKAEECFVAGLVECINTRRVFQEWAGAWARRTITKTAIRWMTTLEQPAKAVQNPIETQDIPDMPLTAQAEVHAILALTSFERLIFVMSTLESYSDNDCAILLSCTRKDVAEARTRALRRLGKVLGRGSVWQTQADTEVSPLKSIFELTIVRYLSASPENATLSA